MSRTFLRKKKKNSREKEKERNSLLPPSAMNRCHSAPFRASSARSEPVDSSSRAQLSTFCRVRAGGARAASRAGGGVVVMLPTPRWRVQTPNRRAARLVFAVVFANHPSKAITNYPSRLAGTRRRRHTPTTLTYASAHTTHKPFQTSQNNPKKTGGIFFIISVVGAAAILLSLLTLCCFCCVKRPGSARRKAKKGSQFVEGDAAAATGYGAAPATAYDTAVPIGGTGVGARDAYAVGTTDTAIKPTHGTAMV